MGNLVSQPVKNSEVTKRRSAMIDKQIEDDSKRLQNEYKVLLLGFEESGKSTIVKQWRMVNGGFSEEERKAYRPIICRNVLDSAHAVIIAMRKIGMDCESDSNRALVNKIVDYRINNITGNILSQEIAVAIHQFAQDKTVREALTKYWIETYLLDRASYFFSQVLRIGSSDYIPTDTDILRAREESTGITETRFPMGQLSIRICEVGDQRSDRRKWIHCFENVTSIIFCVALCDYDQMLSGGNRSRVAESLILFERIINSRWFLRTSIILIFNKIDVFKKKLQKACFIIHASFCFGLILLQVPLEQYFPEYTGGNDVNKAVKYILWKFMQGNWAGLSVYPHLMQETDTKSLRLVFAAVKETILQNALKNNRTI
ncbi:Guanine nucleotide-binding protein alpha-2 subunit [Stygiomarasmius scandens]|uniref:Guanine nucleotide-binding protein alpha-2 subunit n=1 Tax=Marasmiellus scandens TaxID=2682957 RepID=A0ABR1IRG1_9AGAR